MSTWSILPAGMSTVRAAVDRARLGDLPAPPPSGMWGRTSGEVGRLIEGMSDERPYSVADDGTATLAVTGPLFADSAPWYLPYYAAGTTYGHVARAVTAAAADPFVARILMDFDSPGGMVYGCIEAADAIERAGAVKPVIGYARGACASACYVLAAHCSEIVASPTAVVGSLGVKLELELEDRMLANAGIDRITITNDDSPRKAPDLSTADGRADLKIMCNRMYDAMVTAIVRRRGVTESWVRESMGQGAVVVGPDALAAKLIDRIAIGPEAACQPPVEVEAEVEIETPDSPTPGAAGHTTLEVRAMANPATPAANQPDPREAQIAALNEQLATASAKVAGLESVNAALSARVAAFEQAEAAGIEAQRVAARDAWLDAHAKRVGPTFNRTVNAEVYDRLGPEMSEKIAATYPSAGGLPRAMTGAAGATVPATRAELNTVIEAQAVAWDCSYPEAHARLRKEQPGLFATGGVA